MKTNLFALIAALLFFSAQMVEAKHKVLLRINLEKGAEYQMTMNMDNNIDQEIHGTKIKMFQKMEMVTSYKVLDILPDKSYRIEYSMLKMKTDMDINGQKVVLNTDSVGDNVAAKNMKEICNLKMKFTMNSQGKIISIEGIDEYAKMISKNPQLAQTLSMFSNEANFKGSFGQYFGFFPEDKIKVGSKWDTSIKLPALMNMDMLMHFNVADIIDDQVVLNVNSDVNMDSPMETNGVKMNIKATGTQTGIMKLDRKTGLTGSSDMNQKFDMHMKFTNPQSGEEMEFPMIMNSVAKIRTVKV